MSGPDLTAAVEAVLASQWGEDYLGKHAAHANHSYHASCAVCSGDVAAILTVAAPILTAEVAGLQRVIDDQEARLLAQADVIGLMHPVAEYVSRGRSFVDVGPYPDAAARRALGALDDAFASSPQVRKWLSNVKEPVGKGKPDDLAELQRRADELVPGVVAELRAAVAKRNERIACHVEEVDLLRAALTQTEAELDLIARQRQTVLDACTWGDGEDREAVPVEEIHQAFITDPADAPSSVPTEPSTVGGATC